MKKQDNTAYHHGNLKSALVAAGFELLDTCGHEAVTVRGIARLIGVSHAAPVNHFKDRKSLLTELASLTFEQIAAAIALATSNAETTQIACVVAAYEHLVYSWPNRYKLLWRCELLDASSTRLSAAGQSAFGSLESALSKIGISEADLSLATPALWSLMHGYVSLKLDGAMGDTLPSGLPSPTLLQLVHISPLFSSTLSPS